MDIPNFHLDFLNNRNLIAIIAILHVVINHAMAVGGIPLVVWLERRGLKTGEEAWEKLAWRILSTFFVITTTIGALSGVGIWFSAGLVNPYAIGSLIRVFFWTWFVEWIIFVTEVVLILAYYLTWKKWTGARKAAHVRLGYALAIASWITMALIVSILGFMMDTGAWMSDKTLFSGMLNPMYLPQLAFRTPMAMVMAGAFGLIISVFATKKRTEERVQAIRVISKWIIVWMVPCILGGFWYAKAVPSAMAANLPVALLTQALEGWAKTAVLVLAEAGFLVLIFACWGALRPRKTATWAVFVPAILVVGLLGTFERVREFVRKPYAIAGYLYSNGIRKDDYALLQRDGLLTHATYTSVRKITKDNEIAAGREVFTLACTRCHTVDGINGVRGVLTRMYGEEQWNRSAIASYVGSMHNARAFMPPFPGNDTEKEALAAYLVWLQKNRETIEGAQVTGVTVLPRPADNNTLNNAVASNAGNRP